jgi:DNA relaxase NicK
VRIHHDREGYFSVSIEGYGCSKPAKTARDAVYSMLQDHACTDIRITEDD